MKRLAIVLAVLACVPASAQWGDGQTALGSNELLMSGAVATDDAAGSGGGASTARNVLLFDIQPNSGPTKVLAQPMVVSGVTLDTIIDCNMTAAGAASIVCPTGGTFPIVGVSPTLGVASPFTDGSTSVLFTTAQNEYAAPSNTLMDMTTEDFVVEVAGAINSTGDATFGKKDTPTGVDAGWALFNNSSTSVALRVADGTTSIVTPSTVVVSGNYNHFLCFFKYNSATGMQCFANGVNSGGNQSTTTVTGSLTNTITGAIGSSDSTETSNDLAGTVSRVALYKCPAGNPNCLTVAGYQATATERAARFWGFVPSTAAGASSPTAVTRASIATVGIADTGTSLRKMWTVGQHAPRAVRRKELVGGEFVTGYLSEPSSMQLLLQSNVFGTTWTATNLVVTNSVANGPDPIANSAEGLESTDAAGSVEHYIRQNVTVSAVAHTFSVFAFGGDNVTHVWLRDNTVANAIAWFKLSDCTVGTRGAGSSASVAEPNWSGGYCRLSMTFLGTAAAHDVDIGYSNADNVTAYDDGTDSVRDLTVFGSQLEAQPIMTSYINTTTAQATRAADDVRYTGTLNATNGPGVMEGEYLCPTQASTLGYLGIIGTAATTDNRRALRFEATGQNMEWLTDSAGVTTATVTSIIDTADGERHTARGKFATNDFTLLTDGVSDGTPDVAGALPVSSTTIFLGASSSQISQPACVISRLRVCSGTGCP